MKKFLLYFIIVILLMGSKNFFAQSQNNRYQSGIDRDMGTNNKYQAPVKREPIDIVKITTEGMTEQLKLDTFQSAIVKNAIEDFIKKTNDIAIEDIPNEAKAEKNKVAREVMDNKIAEILTEKQKVVFEELKNSTKDTSKKKKKRKDSEE